MFSYRDLLLERAANRRELPPASPSPRQRRQEAGRQLQLAVYRLDPDRVGPSVRERIELEGARDE